MRSAWEQHTGEGRRAVLELDAAEGAALGSALSFYLRRRFGSGEIELSGQALSLRALTAVSDRLGSLIGGELGGRLALSEPELRGLREALCLYVAERDTESYQPPEERERLSELRSLNEPLGDFLAQAPSTVPTGALAVR